MQPIDLLKQFFEDYDYCKKITKKRSNKNFVMSEKDEQRFQSSKKCWIRNKLFDVGDNKVRDHYQITRKYRGSAHQSRNVNLKLTKKVLIIFHNLYGYDSHLIMEEIGNFDAKVNDKPNGLKNIWLLQLTIIWFLLTTCNL